MTVSDTHYKIGNVAYPRVTTILKAVSHDYNGVPSHVMEEAAEFGRQVHSYCTAISRGLDPKIPEHIKVPVMAYTQWFVDTVDEVIDTEFRVICKEHKYAGRGDLLARLSGDSGLTLLDFKIMAQPMKSHQAQTAAYWYGKKEEKIQIERRIGLYINKGTGRIKAVEFPDHARDFNGFLCALQWYKWVQK